MRALSLFRDTMLSYWLSLSLSLLLFLVDPHIASCFGVGSFILLATLLVTLPSRALNKPEPAKTIHKLWERGSRWCPAVRPRTATARAFIQTSWHCWAFDPAHRKSFRHIHSVPTSLNTTAGKGKQQPPHFKREEKLHRDTSLEEIHKTVSAAALYRRGTRAGGGCLLFAAQVGRHSRVSTE